MGLLNSGKMDNIIGQVELMFAVIAGAQSTKGGEKHTFQDGEGTAALILYQSQKYSSAQSE